jgi:hypothetical protein
MIELQITRNTLLVYTYFTYYVSLILVVGVYIAGKPLFDMLYNKLRFRYQKVKYYIQSLS